jgi:hypothetical protein
VSPEEELQACRVERDAALHQLRQVSERLHEIEDDQALTLASSGTTSLTLNWSPLCESCHQGPATHCVTFGFTQFWVCEGCAP